MDEKSEYSVGELIDYNDSEQFVSSQERFHRLCDLNASELDAVVDQMTPEQARRLFNVARMVQDEHQLRAKQLGNTVRQIREMLHNSAAYNDPDMEPVAMPAMPTSGILSTKGEGRLL